MIHPFDAVTLASTKLRTRKVRTLITIVIAGLLFGLICFLIIASTGLTNSLDQISKSGLGERYILLADVDPGYEAEPLAEKLLTQPSIVKQVEEQHQELVAAKTERAKSLEIEYIPKEEDPAPVITDGKTGKKQIDEGIYSQASEQVLSKHLLQEVSDRSNVKSYTDKYSPLGYFSSKPLISNPEQFSEMKNGQEAAIVNHNNKEAPSEEAFRLDDQINREFNSLFVSDDGLIRPYIKTPLASPAQAGAIPVLVPYDYAESALGLQPLSHKSSADKKLSHIAKVREQALGLKLSLCYRNQASQELLKAALAQKTEMKKNAKNPDRKLPDVIYRLPDSENCGPVSIAQDNRPPTEIAYMDKLQQFNQEFNPDLKPVQHKINFQVIGTTPPTPTFPSGFSIAEVAQTMFSSTNTTGWQIPASYYNQLPKKLLPKSVFESQLNWQEQEYTQHDLTLVEFASYRQAMDFVDSNDCHYSDENCFQKEHLVTYPYGTNSFMVHQVREVSRAGVKWLLVIIGALAVIILAGMVGRIVADGRRETAVFRAIGAKRADIGAIYLTYTFLLALRIIIFVAGLGMLSALVAELWVSPQITPAALIAFGAEDLTQTVSLIGFSSIYIIILPLVIILASLLAMILPLLMSIRRNPINDMRQE